MIDRTAYLRLIADDTVPLYAGGAEMPCRLPRWTGGCRTDGRYIAGRRVGIGHPDGGLHLPVSINATAALHQLTYQEAAMPAPRYDYDAHTRAMAGDPIIGTPISDRPLWRDVLLNIAAGAGICGLLLLALTWIIRGAGL